MSPEQADGHEPGAASDVFSLGSVLVFAATGTGPFGTTSNPVAMLVRISRDDPDLSAVPERLRRSVAGCLARDPADRPAAAELARRFAAIRPDAPPPTLVAPTGAEGEPMPLSTGRPLEGAVDEVGFWRLMAIELVVVLIFGALFLLAVSQLGIRR
jgi:serine/threonine protein kinase